jgi:hypothetical protein
VVRIRNRRTTGRSRERGSMFYIILIVVAVVLVGALYFVRGRGRAA